jgi:hypothetical protein
MAGVRVTIPGVGGQIEARKAQMAAAGRALATLASG